MRPTRARAPAAAATPRSTTLHTTTRPTSAPALVLRRCCGTTARHRALALLSIATLTIALAACGSSGSTSNDPTGRTATSDAARLAAIATARPYGVGITTRTFVDSSRTTQANRDQPARPDRTLVTTLVYPTAPLGATREPARAGTLPVPVPDAAADATTGPYPLVVFAHGFGGNEQLLLPLASMWAQAGYIVAIPLFPLTNTRTPGGINGADIANQPGDVGFLFDTLTAPNDTPVNGLVDADRLALAGHSNGGITTLGAIANSCCKDARIGAAIVFAGVTSPFGGGTYDLTDLPPVLFVHGVNDAQIDFEQAARIFNDASTPKAMLRVDTGNHVSILMSSAPEFAEVTAATIDFLDLALLGDPTAPARLAQDQTPGRSTMFFAPDADSAATVKVPVADRGPTDRRATISKQDGLRDGEKVTVTWSGFLVGKTVNIVQCTGDGRGGSETCEIRPGQVLLPNPTGSGRLEMTVTVGKVGNGVCDATHPCTILVNDAGLQEPDAFVYFPVTFAP